MDLNSSLTLERELTLSERDRDVRLNGMSKIPLEIPVNQNWTCHSCGGCCKQHAIAVTLEEQQRIAAQGWEHEPAVGRSAEQLFVDVGGWLTRRWTRLAHQADGSCVFLDESGLCRIHAKFGEPAKPLACRIYPYAFHPAGDAMAVSLRFSCPSVAANLGQPITQKRKELDQLVRLTTPANYRDSPPPRLKTQTELTWDQARMVIDQLDQTISDKGVPLEVGILRTLLALGLLEEAKFAKIKGARVRELVELIFEAAASDLVELPERSAVGRVSMTSFRLLVAQYSRLENFKQLTWSHRYQLLRAALRFSRGQGQTLPLHPDLKAVSFSEIESDTFGCLKPEQSELLRRLMQVKIEGMHFCGRPYYNNTIIEGWYALVLLILSIVYLARWIAVGNGRHEVVNEDVLKAMTIADHHHGYSPALGMSAAKQRNRAMVAKGDLGRLVITMMGRRDY